MTDVVVFHHALGLTPGVHAFADELAAAGHIVHTPDLFEGQAFATVEEGVDHAREIGFDEVRKRGERAVQELPETLVYLGMSLGVMPAQQLAQTRSGARGAVLLHAAVPAEEFGGGWPDGVGLQIHGMEDDPYFDEGDRAAAEKLVEDVEGAELFLYPGDQHLFADSSSEHYDADATSLLTERVLAFLDRV